ncbi:MAG: hypothetical protein ACOX6Z_05535 [Dethiobacteria bacterium]
MDIILNNVGMLQELKPVEEVTEKEREHIFDINEKSVWGSNIRCLN